MNSSIFGGISSKMEELLHFWMKFLHFGGIRFKGYSSYCINKMSNENELKCQYCDRVFSTRYNLYKHQKKTAYCILIQEEERKALVQSERKDTEMSKMESLKDKEMSKLELLLEQKDTEMSKMEALKDAEISKLEVLLEQKDTEMSKMEALKDTEMSKMEALKDTEMSKMEALKDTEMSKMEALKDAEISKLEARLSKHENTIADIARQPRSKINNGIENTMNILSSITTEHLRDQARFLQMEHIQEGMDGYARYALDYPLKNRVVCTDFSRRKIHYKNGDGKVVIDPEMKKLSFELFKAIRERNDELFTDYMTGIDRSCTERSNS